jgi:hypothetical protein
MMPVIVVAGQKLGKELPGWQPQFGSRADHFHALSKTSRLWTA